MYGIIIVEQLIAIAATTGVVLDPTYTLKGVQGLLGEMEKNPARFKGKRILHIHTGNLDCHTLSH